MDAEVAPPQKHVRSAVARMAKGAAKGADVSLCSVCGATKRNRAAVDCNVCGLLCFGCDLAKYVQHCHALLRSLYHLPARAVQCRVAAGPLRVVGVPHATPHSTGPHTTQPRRILPTSSTGTRANHRLQMKGLALWNTTRQCICSYTPSQRRYVHLAPCAVCLVQHWHDHPHHAPRTKHHRSAASTQRKCPAQCCIWKSIVCPLLAAASVYQSRAVPPDFAVRAVQWLSARDARPTHSSCSLAQFNSGP